jgi:hypothetical protein
MMLLFIFCLLAVVPMMMFQTIFDILDMVLEVLNFDGR